MGRGVFWTHHTHTHTSLGGRIRSVLRRSGEAFMLAASCWGGVGGQVGDRLVFAIAKKAHYTMSNSNVMYYSCMTGPNDKFTSIGALDHGPSLGSPPCCVSTSAAEGLEDHIT
jgi:hypothetical protein